MPEIQKYIKTEIWEAMKVSEEMLQKPGLKTLTDFLRNVESVEIESEIRIIIHTPKWRFYVSSGDWVLRDDFLHVRVCTEKVFFRDYKLIKE
jgi:hypothetical protein